MNAGMIAATPAATDCRERRQVNLVQRPLGHFRRGIFATGRNRAIGAEMLGGGRNAILGGKIGSLKAPCLGRRHLGGDPSVLPRTLDDASPARIARHVEHRRKSQGDPVLRSLFGGDARRLLPQIRRELTRFRQRHGKDRVVAMDYVETHEQRNAETGFLDREALDSRAFRPRPRG